jgi:hypothetical protein
VRRLTADRWRQSIAIKVSSMDYEINGPASLNSYYEDNGAPEKNPFQHYGDPLARGFFRFPLSRDRVMDWDIVPKLPPPDFKPHYTFVRTHDPYRTGWGHRTAPAVLDHLGRARTAAAVLRGDKGLPPGEATRAPSRVPLRPLQLRPPRQQRPLPRMRSPHPHTAESAPPHRLLWRRILPRNPSPLPMRIQDHFRATPLHPKTKKSNPTFPDENPTSLLFGAQKGSQTRTTPRSIGDPTCAVTTQPPLGALPLAPSAPWRSFIPRLISAIFAPPRPSFQHSPHPLLQNVRICYNQRNAFPPPGHPPLSQLCHFTERTHFASVNLAHFPPSNGRPAKRVLNLPQLSFA